MYGQVHENSVFSPFSESTEITELAANLSFSLETELHPLCQLAATQLQFHLKHQQDWEHNFGLLAGVEGAVIGKMFGVLVVRNKEGKLGYIAAFSGKLAGRNHHAKFVPPIFDGLEAGGFVNAGMEELSRINEKIRKLEESIETPVLLQEIQCLKTLRKNHSTALQDQIFEQYNFLNKAGQSKNLMEAFRHTAAQKPPAGAGECAAPKLLQYAFLNKMEPLAMAEFWWGLSPKSAYWKHGEFYAPCREKCAPILAHMLS
ncbi:hypothetical protein [Pedobacter nyackensis]|uniref:hypothetical protein n=1 Tax=Pedobacter nyackensis TaxID=475255 RepID=UPI0029309C22|nr:hypothetical protein [Pedobacter nyackensis]